jgi:hypothetical protein
MSKIRQGNKESKKAPLLSSKQKKAAKHTKKHAEDAAPLLSR